MIIGITKIKKKEMRIRIGMGTGIGINKSELIQGLLA